MDKSIDGRFERLEKALSTLIDSVSKYHPSIVQAEELKAADDELGQGLLEVQAHQNNHLRIQHLRRLSASLDAQIRDTLISLATTRKDIVTTQATAYPPAGENHPIAYEELLSYARRISKTSMPPIASLPTSTTSPGAQTPAADSQPQSAATPSAPALVQSPAAPGGASQSGAAMNTSLPDGMSQYLNPLSGQAFFPWPLEDKIRSGSLAANQVLVEQGIDPKNFDPVLQEDLRRKEEEERKESEEREKKDREERERMVREEMEKLRRERERQREKEQAEWRRESVVGGPPDAPGNAAGKAGPSGGGEKKQFQFTNLDDLDDDDDDD